MSVVHDLATFVAGCDAVILPASALHASKRCLIDWLGVALGASQHPSVDALAEWQKLPGRAVLACHVLAVEVQVRLLKAMYPAHYDLGWHTTGTIGTLGAAVGTAKLLGLPAVAVAHALCIGATQAAGLHEMRGSMCKPLHVGKAAANGLLAGLLAREGVTGNPEGFETPRGFFAVFGRGSVDLAGVTRNLGETWEVGRIGFKVHSCGVSKAPLVDAALAA